MIISLNEGHLRAALYCVSVNQLQTSQQVVAIFIVFGSHSFQRRFKFVDLQIFASGFLTIVSKKLKICLRFTKMIEQGIQLQISVFRAICTVYLFAVKFRSLMKAKFLWSFYRAMS